MVGDVLDVLIFRRATGRSKMRSLLVILGYELVAGGGLFGRLVFVGDGLSLGSSSPSLRGIFRFAGVSRRGGDLFFRRGLLLGGFYRR